jgi:hypothetical protein
MWAREWAGIPATGKPYKIAGIGIVKVFCFHVYPGLIGRLIWTRALLRSIGLLFRIWRFWFNWVPSPCLGLVHEDRISSFIF